MFKFVNFSNLLAQTFLLATICLGNGWAQTERPSCEWKLRCNEDRTACFDEKMQTTNAALKPTKRFWTPNTGGQSECNAKPDELGRKMVDGQFLADFVDSLVHEGAQCGTIPSMPPPTGPSRPLPSRGSGPTFPPGSHPPGKTEPTTTPTEPTTTESLQQFFEFLTFQYKILLCRKKCRKAIQNPKKLNGTLVPTPWKFLHQ